MIINLDANWFLDCDTTNVVLTERRIITGDNAKGIKAKAENIGKERLVQHGFYGSIAQGAQAYLNKSVAGMDGMLSVTALIAAWTDMTAKIEASCKGIPKRGDALAPEVVKQAENRMHRQTMLQTADGVVTLPSKSSEPLYSLPQASL
jgi:hypothetical protein